MVKESLTKYFTDLLLNWGKRQGKRTFTWFAYCKWHHCWMQCISSGPLTCDLPLGPRGAERRSPRVVTACALVTSHRSPPLSLQNTMPPTSATLFSVSLGKFSNSLSSRPRHYWWDTIMSLSSRPEACSVGCFDGSNHNLAGNLCLITGSGPYILLIINMVAGVLIPTLKVSNWCDFYCLKKKNCKKKATRLIEPCFTWTVFKKVCHYIFKSFIYTVVVGVFIIKANPSLFCIVKLKDLCWIKSCASMTFHLEIQFSKV